MNTDNEISALNTVYEALKGLDNAQIKRIVVWVKDKFAPENQSYLKSDERESAPSPEPGPLLVSAPVESVKPDGESVTKRRSRRPGKVKPAAAKPVPQPAESPGITGFIKYDNFEELLLFSTANSNTAKILLAAAYLQEKKNLKEFVSYDISTLFKSIGEEVSQPSTALNNLMIKKPPLVIRTGTQGPGLKSRRKFRVTEEGLRSARNYIKE